MTHGGSEPCFVGSRTKSGTVASPFVKSVPRRETSTTRLSCHGLFVYVLVCVRFITVYQYSSCP